VSALLITVVSYRRYEPLCAGYGIGRQDSSGDSPELFGSRISAPVVRVVLVVDER